ncbi:hypothetical protein QQ39_12870 [Pragia fontium]|nr:hypothetical protein QQ39_12870 [Pragia fontium]
MQYKKPEKFTHFGAKSNLKRLILMIQSQKRTKINLAWLITQLTYHINSIDSVAILLFGTFSFFIK